MWGGFYKYLEGSGNIQLHIGQHRSHHWCQFLKKSPLVILSIEKTMVTKVINELKSFSRLKILPENGPWAT